MKDASGTYRIAIWIIAFPLALIPLFFLPITQDFYDANKWMLLITVSLISLILWSYRSLKRSSVTISLSPVFVGFGVITITALLSFFISSPNKIEALTTPFGPTTLLSLTILSLLVPTFLDAGGRRKLLWLLYGVVTILALIAVYEFFGMGKIMFAGVSYIADPLWTPTGSTIATAILCASLLPVIFWHAVGSWKAKNELHLGVLIIAGLAILVGLVITIIQILPKASSLMLPLGDGWIIMLEILKNPKQALFGVGAENFLAAFAAGRPVYMNLSPVWNIRFATNATAFFHITTTYGLIGGAAFLFFIKSAIPRRVHALTWSIVLILLSLFLLPPNFSVIIVLAIILIISSDPAGEKTWKIPSGMWLRILSTLVIAAIVCIATAGIAIQYWAELLFFRSLQKAQENNGTATYNLQIQAIQKDPSVSRFHMIYSQTNLALATSLASSVSTPEYVKDTPEEDKTKDRTLIASLIEQSIREAKIAVSLNPYNVVGWENLARTYKELIQVAQGAEDWTTKSYKEAILRDPSNPILVLELGITYVQIKQYSDAITQFQKAIALKPNYVNAYYNLANAYTLNGDSALAIQTLETALQYTNSGSNDYTIITKELDRLRGLAH